jgi:transcription initiation factor TFIIIB Brf1 subunit/transcription initiation factor TFIIB|uniref:TFIIB-type domain-containing protein n=1 Tax=viral metagenome TaxID=1070528 RepID=A0A6C0H0E7_9ZZZZ
MNELNFEDDIWKEFDLELKSNIEINKNECPECKNVHIIVDIKGASVCQDCGLVLGFTLDKNPEWINGDDGNNGENDRCGNATSYFFPQSSLGTNIKSHKYDKIKMVHDWSQMPYKERSLYEVFQYIDAKCDKIGLVKSIIDNAKILYKHISDLKGLNGKSIIIRGINRKSLIAACVYNGAKNQGLPRTTKEIADIFSLTIKQVTKGNRKYDNLIDNYKFINENKCNLSINYIERFGNKLKIPTHILNHAKQISLNISKIDIACGHQPPSIASASLMIALKNANLDIDKKIISKLFDISDVTITKTYKKILEYEYIIIDNKMTELVLNMSQNEFLKTKLLNKKISNDYINQYFEYINHLLFFNKFTNSLKLNDYKFHIELFTL